MLHDSRPANLHVNIGTKQQVEQCDRPVALGEDETFGGVKLFLIISLADESCVRLSAMFGSRSWCPGNLLGVTWY